MSWVTSVNYSSIKRPVRRPAKTEITSTTLSLWQTSFSVT